MGVRDRLAKVFGTDKPAAIQTGEAAAQMTPASPFGPGQPPGPYDGYSRTPRSTDFVTGQNISARPRSHERVAFETLRGLVEAYDVAQICIWHRIDSIRALDWSLVPARGFSGDAEAAIATGMAALEKPDRQTPFANWLAKYLYDVLAYDAGTLYRLRNRGGRAIGLRVVDGTTIAPLLDYWGNSPEPPAEAYMQYVNGLPWNGLTRSDLVYEPFRPKSNSLYGTAPLETILLNANTDLRFQAYFLQRFTEGNIPEAFAGAPESWTPDQITAFQGYWDAMMLGDQSIKSQIKWMPGGSAITWSNEKDFTDAFSLFLMRKTCSAYHVVPSDLGFTDTVNRSSGETQADVQHRVGDLPLITHVQGILTEFLRHDLGLPVEFAFDTGQEKEDRYALAQAWGIYIDKGMASPDEGREQLLGLPGDPTRPTPRFYSAPRLGPVPLISIDGVGGGIDPETYGPSRSQPELPQPFVPPPGVVPAEGTAAAAESRAAQDAYQSTVQQIVQGADDPAVAKDATAGITSETGITGYDLVDHEGDEDEEQQAIAKRELTAFRRFRQARRRDGKWRDFEFRHTNPAAGHRLNDGGRLAVRKAAGQIAVAGLAVRAADTGRVLMLQRALDDEDPASGMWEFPGGHLEGDESPLAAAVREWSEETGCVLPFNPDAVAALAFENGATWSNGIYQGFVYDVPSETSVPINGDRDITNPDDPDGDQVESVAWWDPAQLAGNPAVRPELLDSTDAVLAALGLPGEDAVQKAGGGAPKGGEGAQWPGWALDLDTADYWAPLIAATLAGTISQAQAEQLARRYAARQQSADDDEDQSDAHRDVAVAAAVAWLTTQHLHLAGPLAAVLTQMYADGYLIGAAVANAVAGDGDPKLPDWTPGDTAKAEAAIAALGDAAGLATLTDGALAAAEGMATTVLTRLARILIDKTGGDSPADIAKAMRDAIADPIDATAIAISEVTRASGAAAIDAYRRLGIAMGEWAIDPASNVCAVCVDNANTGPVPIGDPYPSGHAHAPAHPRCRCAVVPA